MKRAILIILGLLFMHCATAQNDDYSWTSLIHNPASYDSICNAYDSYILTTYPDSIPESALPAIKRYYRYKYFWNNRLGLEDGEVSYSPYNKAVLNIMDDPACEGNDNSDWELLGPSSYHIQWLGLVQEVLYDPINPDRIIISCDRGGIWVKQDSGKTWHNVTDDLHLPALCASEIIRNPFDHDHLIASTSSGVLSNGDYGVGIIESFDNGDSWTVMEGFSYQATSLIRRVIADPNDNNPGNGITLYAITNEPGNGNDKIYISENSGIDWTLFPGPSLQDVHLIDIEIDNQENIFVSSKSRWSEREGKFYKYQAGQWIDCNVDTTFGEFKRIRISTPTADKMYVLCDGFINDQKNRRIYKTEDNGTSWSIINDTLPVTDPCEIEYSPESNIIYIGGVFLWIFKDDNTSTLIRRNPLHVDIRDFNIIGLQSGEENVLIGTDGGLTLADINVNDISDITWHNLNGNHLPIGDFLGIGIGNDIQGTTIVGGTVHCGSWKSENNWERILEGDGGDSEVNWLDNDIFYYQANQWMKTSTQSSGSSFYSNGNDWFIGMK